MGRPTASLKAHVFLIEALLTWSELPSSDQSRGFEHLVSFICNLLPGPSGVLQILTTERERCEYDENNREQQRSQHGPQDRDVLPGRQRCGLAGEGRR